MERALVGFAVSKENHVLALGHAGVYIAKRHGIERGLGRIVGQVDARYLDGREVCVEKLDPPVVRAIFIGDALGGVLNHDFIDAQGRAGLAHHACAASHRRHQHQKQSFFHTVLSELVGLG